MTTRWMAIDVPHEHKLIEVNVLENRALHADNLLEQPPTENRYELDARLSAEREYNEALRQAELQPTPEQNKAREEKLLKELGF